jgi:predicted NBD/HSP70 family sugar kinase
MAYVLFDIGGTKTRVAVSRDLKTFERKIKFDTPADFEDGIGAIHEAIAALTSEPIEALAGGIRGTLNGARTALVNEKKLTGWIEQPIAEALGKPYKAPVYLENDTAVVGLGEAHHGAGKGYGIVVYHTVSTGVGGVRVVNGALDEATVGFEPGHQIIDIDRSLIGADIPHTLENLVSGEGLGARRGVKPYQIPQSDPVWPELARYLAHGLRNTVTYWSPDVIVLGGSMIIGDPRIMLADITRETEAALQGVMPCPPIIDATLSDEGGLYGAMVLIEQRLA